MDDVKNGFSKSKGYEGPGWAVADVNDEGSLADVHALKVESRAGVVADAPEIWIERLLRRNLFPVNPK